MSYYNYCRRVLKNKISPALNMESRNTLQSVLGEFQRDVEREISKFAMFLLCLEEYLLLMDYKFFHCSGSLIFTF